MLTFFLGVLVTLLIQAGVILLDKWLKGQEVEDDRMYVLQCKIAMTLRPIEPTAHRVLRFLENDRRLIYES